MRTDKQLAASRANALKATGPSTPAGKARVGLNALKHGVLAERMVLPDEDPAELDALAKRTHEALRPEGEMERALVERIVACLWRLGRVYQVDAEILRVEAAKARDHDAARIREYEAAKAYEESPAGMELRALRVSAGLGDGVATVVRPRLDGDGGEFPALGRAFLLDAANANALSKLARYEASIERGMYRALHELQRLQAERGARASAPAAVEVDVVVMEAVAVRED